MSASTTNPRGLLPWALAALCALAASVFLIPATASGATGCSFGRDWSTPDRTMAAQVGKLVNRHRASRNLPQLQVNPVLTAAAEWKAGHMAHFGYISHEDPGSPMRDFTSRIRTCGYQSPAGENLAKGAVSPSHAMKLWLASQGHRTAIERPDFREMGIGVVRSSQGGSLYWTQVFGAGRSGASGSSSRNPTKVSRVGRLGRHSVQKVRINMMSRGSVKLSVRALNRSGARPFRVTLHCGSRRLAATSGRRGRTATVSRQLPRGRCVAKVLTGRQGMRYRVTITVA